MAGALGGNQDDIHAGRRLDVSKANVEAVAEHQGFAIGKVRCDVLGVETTLVLIRSQDDDDVRPGRGFWRGHHLEAGVFGLLGGLRAGLEGHNNFNTGVAQVLRVSVAL